MWKYLLFPLICNSVPLSMFNMYFEGQLGNLGSDLTEEELEMHTISAWKEGKVHISRQMDGNARSYPRRLVCVRAFIYLVI